MSTEARPGTHSLQSSPLAAILEIARLAGDILVADAPSIAPLSWGTDLEITLGMNESETRPDRDLMRKLIAALLAGLISSSSVTLAAEVDTAVPVAIIAPEELEKSARPLTTAAAREAMRIASVPRAFSQTPPEQSPLATKPWMERHPFWFGLIAGASAGAAWGALSGRDGFYGPGFAAMVGSWWGAGVGGLIGWGVGRAN
jgi:hypothetical protein